MVQFLKFSIAYLVAAIAIAFSVREQAVQALSEFMVVLVDIMPLVVFWVFTLICLGLLINALFHHKPSGAIVSDGVLAIAATLLFQIGFILIKTSMPYIIPFYADGAFLELDKLLHGGTDPWVLTHRFSDILPIERLTGIYINEWVAMAVLLPVFLATLDNDPNRVRRTLLIYVCAWIVIGNLLALAGMSVGPIFFDRLSDGDYFNSLRVALLPCGVNMQQLRNTQEFLWNAYVQLEQSRGPGISAFPSVHVSVATVIALYAFERSRYLLPIALFWVTAILFMSVYTGYHYAVDGYVSIIAVVAFWLYLRRRDRIVAAYA